MNLPQRGDRVSNYLLEEEVGSGSFGQVWRAKHHVLDEVVAVKVLTDPQYVRNFRTEGVAVHGIQHPNVVRALDLDPYGDPPYLIMEYVDGPSLRSVIDEHPNGLPVDAAIRIMRGMLSGLQTAHEAGLVHRDVKPANILLRMPHGDLGRVEEGDVKLTDFGLGRTASVTTASIMQSGSLTTEEGRSIAGTLAYMSPEQKAGEAVDGRSDLYSCAVVLFEVLTGSRPAGSDLPSMVRPELPGHLDNVFRQAYTRLERRVASAGEMLALFDVETAEARSRWEQPALAAPTGNVPANCPRCSQPLDRDDNFCIACGHQVVDSVPKCPRCQAFVNRSDRFCIFCGSRLRADAAP